MLYRQKPVAVAAWLWGGGEVEAVPDWVIAATRKYPEPGGIAPFFEGDQSLRDINPFSDTPHLALVMTNGTIVRMPAGTWIVRGPEGTLSAVPPAIFAQMYELAEPPPAFNEFDDEFIKSFDAMDWARAFDQRIRRMNFSDIDVAFMHTWFANAMMRGWDERAWKFPYRPSWRKRFRCWLEEKRRQLKGRKNQAAISSSH
jgi:hypothetical protein